MSESIPQFSKVALLQICLTCIIYSNRNPGYKDFESIDSITNNDLINSIFFRSLMNSHESNNGLLFCVNYSQNARHVPLLFRHGKQLELMSDLIFGYKQSINAKMDSQIHFFEVIYAILCENLIDFAKFYRHAPLEIIQDYGEIFAFRIFLKTFNELN
ncbi:MAG: hypothetical protein MHMPM18_002993 [Marteilia pararefringens]